MANRGVTEFLGQFDGGARPNRYKVSINTPAVVPTGPVNNVEFFCRSTSIPAATIGVARVSYFGREIKVTGDRTYDDWTITLYNSADWQLRGFFEEWMEKMLNTQTNITSSLEESTYMVTASVQQLSRNDVAVATYKFSNIFPISVSDIALAFDSNDQVEEYTVTFAVNEVIYQPGSGTFTPLTG